MMKYVFGLGVAAALTWVAPVAEAQTKGLSGSFLNRSNSYTARRATDPVVPEVDPGTLPATTSATNRLETLPTGGGTYHDYTSAAPSYGAGHAPLSSSCASGGISGGCATGGCSDCASASCDGGCSTGIGIPSILGGCCECSPWYGGVYALVMTRSDDHNTYLGYDAANTAVPFIHTGDANINHGIGTEATFGRYLNDCWSVQGTYWGFYPDDQSYTAYTTDTAGGLFSAIGYDGLLYNNGAGAQTVQTFYGDVATARPALAHRIRRNFEAHNFEVNFVRNPYRRNRGCVHFELLAGFRYMSLDDGLVFSTAYNDPVFGNDINNELHHVIDVENHLAGFQLGGRADRYFAGCWGAHVGTKFGHL